MNKSTTYPIPDIESETVEFKSTFQDEVIIDHHFGGLCQCQGGYGVIAPVFEEFSGGFRVVLFKGKQVAVNEGLKGVEKENVGVNKMFEMIKDNPGIKATELHQSFDVTGRTIERWLKQLREQGKIEFRGAPKTGGYYVKD